MEGSEGSPGVVRAGEKNIEWSNGPCFTNHHEFSLIIILLLVIVHRHAAEDHCREMETMQVVSEEQMAVVAWIDSTPLAERHQN